MSLRFLQWVLTGWACYMYSMVSVPLYDTLGEEACNYIINQSKIISNGDVKLKL